MVLPPKLTWYEVNLGVKVAGVRVPVQTSMLASDSNEVHDRCKRVAEGMGGVISDSRVVIKDEPPGQLLLPQGGYVPPPCTYKADPPPDKIMLDPAEGWEEYKEVSPGGSAFLGGPRNDKVAT